MLALVALMLAACQPAAATVAPVETQAPAATVLPAEPTAVAPTAAVPTAAATADTGVPPTGAQAPEGWNELTDAANGYSVAYPPVWEICQEQAASRIFCEIQAVPEGMGPPLRMYISVIPQDATNENFEIYNFFPPARVREFMALEVGESLLKEPRVMAPEFFTYTRLPDRMVAGWTALVVENSKPWEFPAGTKDRVVFIVTEADIYMIGMYYQTPEQLQMFEQALDSFQFVP